MTTVAAGGVGVVGVGVVGARGVVVLRYVVDRKPWVVHHAVHAAQSRVPVQSIEAHAARLVASCSAAWTGKG